MIRRSKVITALVTSVPACSPAERPDGLTGEIEGTGFTGVTSYGVEGPGWPLRQEWADPQRREQILFAARAAETEPTLAGFSHHLIAAATRP